MKVSPQLQSQTMSKYLIADLLYKSGRLKWCQNHSRHELIIEPWKTGIWIKQEGLVSYSQLAEALKLEAEIKAYNLSVQKISQGFLVSSSQSPEKNYFVQFDRLNGWRCNCMRWKCWKNRMANELPQLLKHFNGKIFCHHAVAAYNYLQMSKP